MHREVVRAREQNRDTRALIIPRGCAEIPIDVNRLTYKQGKQAFHSSPRLDA